MCKVELKRMLLVLGSLSVMGTMWADPSSRSSNTHKMANSGQSISHTSYAQMAHHSRTSGIIEGILVEYRTANAYGAHLAPSWEINKRRTQGGNLQEIISGVCNDLPSIHDPGFRQTLEEEIQRGEAMAIELSPIEFRIGDTLDLEIPNLSAVSTAFTTDHRPIPIGTSKMGNNNFPISLVTYVEANDVLRLNMVSPMYRMSASDTTASQFSDPFNFQQALKTERSAAFNIGFVRRTDPGHLSVAVLYLTPRL